MSKRKLQRSGGLDVCEKKANVSSQDLILTGQGSRRFAPFMSRPLAGLSFALSGFVNPERANLRQAGLDLGAKYHPDWTPSTTHLICALAGTPKAIQVNCYSFCDYLVTARCRYSKQKQTHTSWRRSGCLLARPLDEGRMKQVFL